MPVDDGGWRNYNKDQRHFEVLQPVVRCFGQCQQWRKIPIDSIGGIFI